MLLNFEWSIPAWILLACHFIFDISILWFAGAMIAWVVIMTLWMAVVGWAAACSNEPTPYRENKNPYSHNGGYPTAAKDEKTKSDL